MEALPLAFTTGWASGINADACVLILGLLGRFARVAEVPHALTRRGLARLRAWRERRRAPAARTSVA